MQVRLLRGQRRRLGLITAGNAGNDALEVVVRSALAQIESALVEAAFVELARDPLTIRNR